MQKNDNQVFLVKLSGSRNATVYGVTDDLNHVAASIKMFMGWLPATFEWLGVTTVIGGSGDHPRTSRVKYATAVETTAFLNLMETIESEPIPEYTVM